MSGGRIGNVAHVLKDGPNMPGMKQIIVVAGTNDILQEGETEEVFVTKVSKGVELLQHQAFQDARALTVVAPPLPPDLSALQSRKRDRLDILMRTLSTKEDNAFNFLPCPSDIQMDHFHPTEEGTKKLLQYINSTVPIIHNPAFITHSRFYNGVESIYRYGCITCMKHLQLDYNFTCPDCLKDLFSGHDTAILPTQEGSLDISAGEIDMGDADKKRSGGDDIDVTPAKSKRTDGGD